MVFYGDWQSKADLFWNRAGSEINGFLSGLSGTGWSREELDQWFSMGNGCQKLTFSEPNDGVVTVQSTKLEGMADWVLLNHGHTFIMNCRDTFECSLRFLEAGRFQEIPKDASKKGG